MTGCIQIQAFASSGDIGINMMRILGRSRILLIEYEVSLYIDIGCDISYHILINTVIFRHFFPFTQYGPFVHVADFLVLATLGYFSLDNGSFTFFYQFVIGI